ncbi:MAG: hypothetical protein V4573_06250, partial [Pseudomonadota bacterium]
MALTLIFFPIFVSLILCGTGLVATNAHAFATNGIVMPISRQLKLRRSTMIGRQHPQSAGETETPRPCQPTIPNAFSDPISEIVLHPPLHRSENKKAYYRIDSRLSLQYLGWLMGLEPTTTGITILD